MNTVTDVVLPIALAFIMFSLGLGLSLNDFTRIFSLITGTLTTVLLVTKL